MGLFGSGPKAIEPIVETIPSVVRPSGYAPALTFSWEDMCTERGGGTIIVFVVLLCLYVGARGWIYYSGVLKASRFNPAPPSGATDDAAEPLYNINTERTLFKKFMALVEMIFVSPFVPMEVHSFVMWIFNVSSLEMLRVAERSFFFRLCYILRLLYFT